MWFCSKFRESSDMERTEGPAIIEIPPEALGPAGRLGGLGLSGLGKEGPVVQAAQEQSEQKGRLISAGMLLGDSDPALWRGGASLANRLEAGDISQAEVDAFSEQLPRFFVPVTPGAPRRCVDDRAVAGFEAQLSVPLGPQYQGGTLGDAYAWRLAKLAADRAEGRHPIVTTIADDVSTLMTAEAVRLNAPAPGAHYDDHHQPGATGCGWADGLPAKNERIASQPELMAAVAATTKAVFESDGKQVPDGALEAMVASARELAQFPHYFSSMAEAFTRIQQASPDGTPTYTGAHNALSVTVNLARGTTFNNSAFAAKTHGTGTNFNLDAWYVLDTYSPEQAAMMVADAVATLATLTDGSIRVYVHAPQE